MATIKKAQTGKTLKPNYSNIKGKGWDAFKTPTSKDSADYREGFDTKLKGETIKQYPSPSGAKVRGYNEASKKTTPKAKDGKWIQKAVKTMRTDKPCTGSKFGSTTCPAGSKRYNLAKVFKGIANKKK